MNPRRVVMVYVEPTPYIVGFVNALRAATDAAIEVYYVATDVSQPWKLQIGNDGRLLPAGFAAKMRALWRALSGDRSGTILHLAGWGHPILLAALILGKVRGVPVAVESDTAEGRSDRGARRRLKALLYPLLFQLPERFLPAGKRQVRYLAGFGVEPARMTVAQMTVDVEGIRRFCTTDREVTRSTARRRWGMAADELVILYMGRLENYKGIEVLLSAFARAAREQSDLRLAIAGDGSLRPLIETVAADPGRRVAYLGRLAGDDVLRAYVAADYLVLPSRFEPWGLVVNEAMACGLPVIVSDRVGCADDLVRPGETGLIAGAGRDFELAEAILHLARDAPARRRMGQAAETVISGWTLANEAHNIIAAWREMAR